MERKVLLICAGGMSTGILMRKMEKICRGTGNFSEDRSSGNVSI